MDKYPNVMKPIQIGPVEVSNRLYMSPHAIPLTAGSAHGSMVPSADYARYFEERARGGIGLIFHSMSAFARDWLCCARYEESIPSFEAVAERVHGNGSKLFGQICYYHGHGSPWEPMSPMAPSLGPSGFQRYATHDTLKEMSTKEIDKMVETFAICSRNLATAGYDGIEVHAGHGVLLEHFLSPYFNRRSDAYGGRPEGRMRLAVELLEAVREAVGPERAVGIRLNIDEMLPRGITQDDSRAIVRHLVERELVDFVDMDVSVEPSQARLMTTTAFVEPGFYRQFVAGVAPAARPGAVVIGVAGRLTTVAQAEELLSEGVYDLVGAVRGLIAEPEMLKNSLEGREDRNRTCIACNTCLGGGPQSGTAFSGWGCSINPGSGREGRWSVDDLVAAPNALRVVVVGAGPAGLEAARMAALRGHEVVVFERNSMLGGQLRTWASLPQRDVLCSTIEWYERQLAALDIEIRLNVEADAASVRAERPRAVVIATGATYDRTGESGFLIAPIPGHDRAFVHSVEDVLVEGRRPTGTVLILEEEGIHTGVGIAELLATSGSEVILVTRDYTPASTLIASFEAAYILPRLKSLGVEIVTESYVREIGEGEVTIWQTVSNEETNAVSRRGGLGDNAQTRARGAR